MDAQTLIEIARQAEQEAEAEKAARREAERAWQAQALAPVLTTEVWQFLHMNPLAAQFLNDHASTVRVDGWLEVDGVTVPCYVTTDTYKRGSDLVLVNLGVSVKLAGGAAAVGRALEDARHEIAKRRRERIEKLARKLTEKSYAVSDWIEQAMTDARELCDLAPERKEEWHRLLEKQLAWATEKAEEDAERKEWDERKERERSEYAAALAAWSDVCDETDRENLLWTEQMQAKADQPFDVAKVTYAIAATDDDGDPMIDTNSTYVVMQESYPGGWFLVYPALGLTPFRRQYRHVVSIDQPVTLRPTSRDVVKVERQNRYQILTGPATSQQVIDEWRAGLAPLPAMPKAPSWMSNYEAQMLADVRY